MRGHIQEHVSKYFPEEEPVVLEEIVVPEEEEKAPEEEEDGKIKLPKIGQNLEYIILIK